MYQSMLELASGDEVSIHSYILLDNCLELLVTPNKVESLPRFMQSLGRRYVGFYNKKYERSGTLWEDRYKASLVEAKIYALWVMRYIESKASSSYAYSSASANLGKREDPLIKKLPIYESASEYERLYKSKDTPKDHFVEEMITRQLPIATPIWIKKIERIMGLALEAKERGRPKKEERVKMYKNLVVLDKKKHSDLRVMPLSDLEFARGSVYIPTLANEIMRVCDHFPVVVSKDGALMTLVSLGGDSLAINDDGRWITHYIPAHIRRYPFSLASPKDNPDQRVVLIDEDSGLFSRSEGNALFEDGEASEVLKGAIEFLNTYDANARTTSNIIKELMSSGVMEDREISIGEGDEKKVLVDGFMVVDKTKLDALDDATLASWARRGVISFIEAHLRSLESIEKLFELAQRRQR